MKKPKAMRFIGLLLAIALLAVSLESCSTASPEATSVPAPSSSAASTLSPEASAPTQAPTTVPAQPVTLNYWQFGNPVQDEDSNLPQDQWYISQAIKRFEIENPNVTVNMTILPMDASQAEKFKAAGVAQNGPDVTFLNTGGMLSDNKQFILPLDKYFTADELKEFGSSILPAREGYKPDGTLLGIPLSGIDTVVLFYNKALFQKAGLDSNAPPKTMDELYAYSQKLKDSGVIPLAVGDQDGGVGTVFFMMTLYATATGNDGIQNKVQGKDTFSSDPDWIATVKAWQQMYSKGYTNKDVASLPINSAQALFINQQAAMFCAGEWVCSTANQALGDNLGITTVPALTADAKHLGAIVGGPGNAFVVTSYSKNPDTAVQFIKFLSKPDEIAQEITVRYHGGNLTWCTSVPDSVITDPTTKMIKSLITSDNVIPWMDNQLPASVSSELYRMDPLMLSGKMTAEDFSKQLDDLISKELGK